MRTDLAFHRTKLAVWLSLWLCGGCSVGQDALRARAGAGHDPEADASDVVSCDAGEDRDAGLAIFMPASDPALATASHKYFALHVLDAADRSPIAGARVETVAHVVYVSDKNGVIAFYEPGWMGRDTFFTPAAEGYEVPADAFGYRGKVVRVDEGKSGELLLNKIGTPNPPVTSDLDSRLIAAGVAHPAQCFAIQVIDAENHRGIPLVFVRNADEEYVSDSQGLVAYCRPDRMGQTLSFALTSHGYSFPPGMTDLTLAPGKQAVLQMERVNIAERLYRSTGQGIYRDSILLGRTTPLVHPLINGQVVAQDAVATARYKGGLFWTWGSTDRANYPLGNLLGSAASSKLPVQGGLDPGLGVNFSYVTDAQGFARAHVGTVAPDSLATWFSSLVAVRDAAQVEQMFAVFVKPHADLSVERRGLLRYDASTQTFVDAGVQYPLADDYVVPSGQPVSVVQTDGSYMYYASSLRVPARAEAFAKLSSYEVWSALPRDSTTFVKKADGRLDYAFRAQGKGTTPDLIKNAGFPADQVLDGQLIDAASNLAIRATGSGAQLYSTRHGRFARLLQQVGGVSSFLGEIWYLEADTPMGPWVYARKVLTHDAYTFYQPWFQEAFTQSDGRYVFFEGTYTSALAGSVPITPRYTRNQIMYRLDLDDPRLALPVPVYVLARGAMRDFVTKRDLPVDAPALAPQFFAPERADGASVPVVWSAPACKPRRLLIAAGSPLTPLFYVRRAAPVLSGMVPLYELSDATGNVSYALQKQTGKTARVFAQVWPSPMRIDFPTADYFGALHADAGPDQCLQSHASGPTSLQVDGSASRGLGEKVVRYVWREHGQPCPLAEGASAKLSLPVGLHEIELEITGASGATSRDSLLVLVEPSGTAD